VAVVVVVELAQLQWVLAAQEYFTFSIRMELL
jgi:hypothetical protein